MIGRWPLDIQLSELSSRTDREIARLAEQLAGIDPWLRLGYAKEGIERYLHDPEPSPRRLALVVDGEMAGVISLRYPWLKGVYVEMFAVLPEAQGKRLGSHALAWIETEYRERTGNIWLLVSAFNDKAKGFYGANGFIPIGEIKDFLMEGEDEVLMRKVICPIGA